jgi:hypothetical protein
MHQCGHGLFALAFAFSSSSAHNFWYNASFSDEVIRLSGVELFTPDPPGAVGSVAPHRTGIAVRLQMECLSAITGIPTLPKNLPS